jgi:hypothetical protein
MPKRGGKKAKDNTKDPRAKRAPGITKTEVEKKVATKVSFIKHVEWTSCLHFAVVVFDTLFVGAASLAFLNKRSIL